MQPCLKKAGVELELLLDTDMLLMIEKEVRGGTFHTVYRYAKANQKCMGDHDQNKESLHLTYLDANNVYGGAMP